MEESNERESKVDNIHYRPSIAHVLDATIQYLDEQAAKAELTKGE